MDERIRVWRAHLGTNVNATQGHSVFCHYGYLSPCGEWVESGDTRWRRTDHWCFTEAEARARLAPLIAQIGARMLTQASELLEAAKQPEVAA